MCNAPSADNWGGKNAAPNTLGSHTFRAETHRHHYVLKLKCQVSVITLCKSLIKSFPPLSLRSAPCSHMFTSHYGLSSSLPP